MVILIVDFIIVTTFLATKEYFKQSFEYISVVCFIVSVICFAMGLGPIPFLFVAESFPQSAKSSALSICMLINWFCNFVLTFTFPFVEGLIGQYVFLIFAFCIVVALVFIETKMPETKGLCVEEIMELFAAKSSKVDKSEMKLLTNSTNHTMLDV